MGLVGLEKFLGEAGLWFQSAALILTPLGAMWSPTPVLCLLIILCPHEIEI